MNVANARYHSLLGDNVFQFWFTLRVQYGKLQTLGREGLRTKPKAEPRQLYGRSTLMTGSISNGMPEYTNEFYLDFRKYRDVSQSSSRAQKVVSTS